jgi:UDP-N-acetylglucosamine:LPS N-acetylglucosamine transferase
MDYTKLFNQGRAKTPGELWTPEENEAVHKIANERHVSRESAADYVRNGILTLEDFDAAVKKAFTPLTYKEMIEGVFKSAKETVKKAVLKPKKTGKKK